MKKKKSVKYTAIERRRRKLVINRKFKLSLPKFEFHCTQERRKWPAIARKRRKFV